MKKFFYKLLVYSIIFLFAINLISFLGREALKRSSVFKPSFLANNFNPQEKFDYFILGSSRGLTTLNSNLIDQNLNSNGVNISMDDTDLKTQLLMLKHFYSLGFKSDYCILVLDNQHFEITNLKLGDNDYRFLPFIGEKLVREHFKQYEKTFLKPLSNALYFPFLSYAYYNLQLIPASGFALINPKKRNRFDERGNYSYPNQKIKESEGLEITKITSQITNNLVEEARNICKQNNTELVIYIAPYKRVSIELSAYKNLINHSNVFTNEEFFFDDVHVNSYGREYATNAFIEAFKKIYNKEKMNP